VAVVVQQEVELADPVEVELLDKETLASKL
jgi:hypothetical protein